MVYLINALARFLGFILRIDHNLHKEFKTIVIAKYIGLGSIIQATPFIQTLRKKFPDAKIIFVSTQANSKILQLIPELDETFLISDKNPLSVFISTTKLVWNLWKEKPQLFIDLEFYSNYSSIVTTLSKATNRLGFFKKDKTYRKGVYNYLVPFNVDYPISETYLQFARLVNCAEIVTSLKIETNDSKSWQETQKILSLSSGEKYVVINPNASDLRIERRWPKEAFVELVNNISQDNKIIFIGDHKEQTYVNSITNALKSRQNVIDSSGKLNLNQLLALIKNARVMITNDTGPMHMAFALGTKTVALFGPCSPLQYGGHNKSITLYKKVACSPCVHNFIKPPCHGNNICMKNISVKEVEDAFLNALAN